MVHWCLYYFYDFVKCFFKQGWKVGFMSVVEKYVIECSSNLGDIDIFIPVSYKECIGSDLFNYSNSTITGVVLDTNNNIKYYVRWSAWSYPQYRLPTNSYSYENLIFSSVSGTYDFYGSDVSFINRNSSFLTVSLLALVFVFGLCAILFKKS